MLGYEVPRHQPTCATCNYSLMSLAISWFSAYSIIKTTVIAGKIRHVKGTKIAGKNDADIVKSPVKLNYEFP